jgi:hypothetical protein
MAISGKLRGIPNGKSTNEGLGIRKNKEYARIFVFERRCYSNEEMVEYIYGANDPDPYTFLHWVRRDIKLHRV